MKCVATMHEQFILLENNPYRQNIDVSNQADVEFEPTCPTVEPLIYYLLRSSKNLACRPSGVAFNLMPIDQCQCLTLITHKRPGLQRCRHSEFDFRKKNLGEKKKNQQ